MHKIPPVVPILNQIKPILTANFYIRSILILFTQLRLGFPSALLLSDFPIHTFRFPFSCYMPGPSQPTSLDHSNYIWRRVQFMKILIMQFSPPSRHLLFLRSKYSQCPVLKHSQFMFFKVKQSVTHIQNCWQNYHSDYSNFYVFELQTRIRNVLGGMVADITRIQSLLNFLLNMF
jgi:hypothetical protein